MATTEENLKRLVGTLIHDVRNHVNGIVLELTDLRERWPERRVTGETESLLRQSMEAAARLRVVRERLDPPPPRLERPGLGFIRLCFDTAWG